MGYLIGGTKRPAKISVEVLVKLAYRFRARIRSSIFGSLILRLYSHMHAISCCARVRASRSSRFDNHEYLRFSSLVSLNDYCIAGWAWPVEWPLPS